MSQQKILFVVTSSIHLGNTGKLTGWFLPEVAHPYDVVTQAGYKVDFVSPKGGKSQCDPGSIEKYKSDVSSQTFLKEHGERLNNTMKPVEVNPSDYVGMFYAGGYGPMFDLPDNVEIAAIASRIYQNGGVIGTLCHGPCGLLNVRLDSGDLLLKDQTITGFTNEEEEDLQMTKYMPFLLETRLKECGAKFEGGNKFQSNVRLTKRSPFPVEWNATGSGAQAYR